MDATLIDPSSLSMSQHNLKEYKASSGKLLST